MVPYLPNPTAFLQAELTGTPSELSQLAGPLQGPATGQPGRCAKPNNNGNVETAASFPGGVRTCGNPRNLCDSG
jgi:hypothetical protein